VFTQEVFQRFKCGRSDQNSISGGVTARLPTARTKIGCEHLIDNIDRLYRCADMREKLVIGGGIFALNERGRTKQC
jgi:hypothetical protein